MIFTKRDLEEKLGFKNEERKLVMNFQKKIPILDEVDEDIKIDARDLHSQIVENQKTDEKGKLIKGTEFAKWIKRRISSYDFKENEDYTTFVKCDDGFYQDENGLYKNKNTNKVIPLEYKITFDMAKELCMLENNETGKLTRKYFILMEKAVKHMIEWRQIREPEKLLYKQLCVELDKFLQRNYNKRPQFYDYANEADALNLICLGSKAKDILEYFDTQDKNTRDHLLKEYNEYLLKIQELDIMYLRMNMAKEVRYDLIKQGFKALYPYASYIISNKTNRPSA